MIIDTINLKNKTVFHEVNNNENYNSLSVMDYSTNKQGKHQKINNGLTSVIDYYPINDNQLLLSYCPSVIKKITLKVLTLEGTYIDNGPSFTIDSDTTPSKISITHLSNNFFVIFYNDYKNSKGKYVIVKIDNIQISTVSSGYFIDGNIEELNVVNVIDNEIALFFQYKQTGTVQLLEFKKDSQEKLIKKEEAIFFQKSNLKNLTIKKIKDYYVMGFINSNHMLCLKILNVDTTIKFTHGIQYNQPIKNDFYQMFAIDNEMILCYFNNTVQIINLINGQMIQPENL